MLPDVVSLTERLVRVDTSPGSSTLPLVELLADELTGLGARVQVQQGRHGGIAQGNLVGRFGGDGPAGLVLAGHLDTVPWRPEQRATIKPSREGRTLYGRGTADMKGALAAQLVAAASTCAGLGRPLLVAWTHSEEVGCHGALQLVDDGADLLGDLRGAVCIVGEPTGLVPVTEHKGYGIVHIGLNGEPAHSSDPWAGADASLALGALLRDLHELREVLRRQAHPGCRHRPPCTTLNTGLVRAGTARNVVPDRAEVTLEFRCLPGADPRDVRRRIEACVALACASAPGVTAALDWVEDRAPFVQPEDHPLVTWISARTGSAPGVVPFFTEAGIYRTGLALPTVVCGPGSIGQAHRVDESIGVDELEAGRAFYADAIRAFCA